MGRRTAASPSRRCSRSASPYAGAPGWRTRSPAGSNRGSWRSSGHSGSLCSPSFTYPIGSNSNRTNQKPALSSLSFRSGIITPSSFPSTGFCSSSSNFLVPSIPVNLKPFGTWICATFPRSACVGPSCHWICGPSRLRLLTERFRRGEQEKQAGRGEQRREDGTGSESAMTCGGHRVSPRWKRKSVVHRGRVPDSSTHDFPHALWHASRDFPGRAREGPAGQPAIGAIKDRSPWSKGAVARRLRTPAKKNLVPQWNRGSLRGRLARRLPGRPAGRTGQWNRDSLRGSTRLRTRSDRTGRTPHRGTSVHWRRTSRRNASDRPRPGHRRATMLD